MHWFKKIGFWDGWSDGLVSYMEETPIIGKEEAMAVIAYECYAGEPLEKTLIN